MKILGLSKETQPTSVAACDAFRIRPGGSTHVTEAVLSGENALISRSP
jgi:hypothetical protein